MRDISLDEQSAVELPVNTFLIYGDTRTGKTQFAGSFPRPLFLSDATEQGWETLRTLDRETQLFEPDVPPIVWAISEMNDMAVAVERMRPLIAAKRVMTIVIDSISFYADLYLNHLINLQTTYDPRSAYGSLGIHLRDLRVKLHGLGVNVVWLALAKHPDESSVAGGPMIPGQQGPKLAAGVNFIFHTRVDQTREGGKIISKRFELRTQPFSVYVAGGRLGAGTTPLPDPLVGTYDEFLVARELDPSALRKSLPPAIEVKPQPVIKSVPPKTPPISNTSPKVVSVPPSGGNNKPAKQATK